MTIVKKAKQRAYWKGILAERCAEIVLRCKGYQLLKRRYISPFGEIDLVMKKGHVLIGIEVKARTTHEKALESLSAYQRKRIARSLEAFQARHRAFHHCTLRLDFVSLVGLKLHHIKGAWGYTYPA